MPRLRTLATFLLAAPWPNVTALASLGAAALLWRLASGLLGEGRLVQGHLLLFPTLGWAALAAICWLDAISRHRDYARLKGVLLRRGFHPRLFALVSTSRCQRDAALHAAREAGCAPQARAHFRGLGYRWYHLLPDPVVDNPLTFFDLRFLRRAFLPGKRA
jgi:hypothetical protein